MKNLNIKKNKKLRLKKQNILECLWYNKITDVKLNRRVTLIVASYKNVNQEWNSYPIFKFPHPLNWRAVLYNNIYWPGPGQLTYIDSIYKLIFSLNVFQYHCCIYLLLVWENICSPVFVCKIIIFVIFFFRFLTKYSIQV